MLLLQIQERFAAKKNFASDEARLAWLNRRVYVAAELTGAEDWARLLTRLAKHRAKSASVPVSEAWFQVAFALADAFPDPKDYLLGIDAAAEAQRVGIAYDDVERYLRLFGGYRKVFEEWGRTDEPDPRAVDEFPFHDFVKCRLNEIETAMEKPLQNGTVLTDAHLADPDVVVAAGALLWETIESHDQWRKKKGEEMDVEEIETFIDDGGHFLWACFHARRQNVEHDELATFAFVFTEEWFELMGALIARDLLAPGVLDALAMSDGSYDDTVARGVDLVAEFRARETDMTLMEYLNCCLAAVTQDA